MKFPRPLFTLIGLSVSIVAASAAARPGVRRAKKAAASSAKVPAKLPNAAKELGAAYKCTESSPPTKKQCLAPRYLDSPCGIKFKRTCKPFIENGLAELYTSSPLEPVPMLRANRHDIPADLKDGKVWEYTGPKKSSLIGRYSKLKTLTGKFATKAKSKLNVAAHFAPGTDGARARRLAKPWKPTNLGTFKKKLSHAWLVADNIFARTGLTRPPAGTVDPNVAKNAHRNPAWEANGEELASCEEYGYEKIYDWARFTDSMAACGGDHHCQMEVAYLPATPGIVGRKLRSRDGKQLAQELQPNGIAFTRWPKNDMFALGPKFARAAGKHGLPPNSDIEELVAALKQGERFYDIGPAESGPRGFKDIWEFHRKLYQRNKTLSKAEFEEYEARKAKFRELVSQWSVAAKAEEKRLVKLLSEQHMWVDPLDTLTADPFERVGLMRDMMRSANKRVRRLRKRRPGLFKKLNGAGTINQPVMPSAQSGPKAGIGMRSDPTLPLGIMASMTKPLRGAAARKRAGGRSKRNIGDRVLKLSPYSCAAKNFDSILESAGIGPASCRIGRFLREEWVRKKRGQKSCLDLGNDDCDWSPSMFEARVARSAGYLRNQNEAETRCLDYTGDSFSSPPSNIAQMEEYINETAKQAGAALRALRPYEQAKGAHGKRWGRNWTDRDHFGDKDWFAAGYDYDLGWDVTPVASNDNTVCQIGGGARGGFGVDAWFIKQKIEVVDGLATADYNRNADKKTQLHAHLRVLSRDLIGDSDGVDATFVGAWESKPKRKKIQIPAGVKPSFTFMAGPVPITGAAWGEFFYGVKFNASLVSETNPNCDLQAVKFGATAGFIPELGLNAKAQVGVGISGLLSAGVRGLVNLVTIGVPVKGSFETVATQVAGLTQQRLDFELDVQLSLETLSGWLAIYVEALLYEEEFVLFRWNGVGPETISLLGQPLEASLPVAVMGK